MSVKALAFIAVLAGLGYAAYDFTQNGVPTGVQVNGSMIINTLIPGKPGFTEIKGYRDNADQVLIEATRILDASTPATSAERVKGAVGLGYQNSFVYPMLTGPEKNLVSNETRDALFRNYYNGATTATGLYTLLKAGSTLFNPEAFASYAKSVSGEARHDFLVWQQNSLSVDEKKKLQACQDFLYHRYDNRNYFYIPNTVLDYGVIKRPALCPYL